VHEDPTLRRLHPHTPDQETPREGTKTLDEEHILDLTIYEVGNALWKINKLLDKTDAQKAHHAIEEAHPLLSLMNAQKLEDAEDLTRAHVSGKPLTIARERVSSPSLVRGSVLRMGRG